MCQGDMGHRRARGPRETARGVFELTGNKNAMAVPEKGTKTRNRRNSLKGQTLKDSLLSTAPRSGEPLCNFYRAACVTKSSAMVLRTLGRAGSRKRLESFARGAYATPLEELGALTRPRSKNSGRLRDPARRGDSIRPAQHCPRRRSAARNPANASNATSARS